MLHLINFFHLFLGSYEDSYLERTEGDGVVAEAAALSITEAMMNVRMVVAVVMVEEVIMLITAKMIEAGDLEVGALGEEVEGVGVLEAKETGVLFVKAVLREGLKLSSGTGKGIKPKLETRVLMITVMMTAIVMAVMEMPITKNNTMTPIRSDRMDQMMEVTTTDANGWFVHALFKLFCLTSFRKKT